MLNPFHTGIRRTAGLFAALGLAALVAVPVAASKPVPGPAGPSIQDIQTAGHNWAAKALLLNANGGVLTSVHPSAQNVQTLRRWNAQGRLVDAKALPSAQDIRTQGNNWAAKGSLLAVDNSLLLRRSLPSAQDILTQGNNWAAKGKLLNRSGGRLAARELPDGSGSTVFHWNEFGIGAGAMLALVLLLGVVLVGFRVVHPGSMSSQGRTA